jgi:hypothetical protein
MLCFTVLRCVSESHLSTFLVETEIDPEQCGYTTFLGAAVPTPHTMESAANGDDGEGDDEYER